jgi:hypothetical protein
MIALASACSRTGSVQGEIVATLTDGRQQRAYRVDVLLLTHEPFEGEWTKLVAADAERRALATILRHRIATVQTAARRG